MGRRFRCVQGWYILVSSGRLAGLVLLADHGSTASELVYMGLAPWARGQGLSSHLLARAVKHCKVRSTSMLICAVDTRNLPALRAYQRCGFKEHRLLKVLLWRE
jgi:ribosomal protein S18 acetylase RimI-like enzyme